MQISVRRCQIDAAKVATAKSYAMLADVILKYNAEDWLWRKRYRTLYIRHRRWLDDIKRKELFLDSLAEVILADPSAKAV